MKRLASRPHVLIYLLWVTKVLTAAANYVQFMAAAYEIVVKQTSDPYNHSPQE